ncbi:subtilisin-like serine protease [Phlyctochytrium bullatum]|nr:subtilisin-like serine protease [Phlyctochytrium bullatum]
MLLRRLQRSLTATSPSPSQSPSRMLTLSLLLLTLLLSSTTTTISASPLPQPQLPFASTRLRSPPPPTTSTATSNSSSSPPLFPPHADGTPGHLLKNQYTVLYRRNASLDQIHLHEQWLESASLGTLSQESSEFHLRRRDAGLPELEAFEGFKFLHKFGQGVFGNESLVRGYTALMSDDASLKIRKLNYVYMVEQDSLGKLAATQASPPTWGIRRITKGSWPPPSDYTYPDAAGSGVDIYVLDTGLDVNNPEWEGRATVAANFADSTNLDLDGHGTGVASIIASKTYGVAKKATIISVKISTNLTFFSSNLLAGLSFVANTIQQRKRPSVVNLSLVVSRANVLDDAVSRLQAFSSPPIVVVAAAGNNAANACDLSPARLPLVLTVSSIDAWDNFSRNAGRGACVKTFAAGESVPVLGLNNAATTVTGTSVATPHVSGIAAIVLSTSTTFPRNRALMDYIRNLGIPNKVSFLPAGTVGTIALLPGAPDGPGGVALGAATTCAHDVCTVGAQLDPNCDNCVAAIASNDDFCGDPTAYWDETCVGLAKSICGRC